ncbi:STM3941 family protein [Flavobacterium lindanitolerans]|jgi:hypothetical protein|uniref:STM3941 family protein n=1 Tax=Flavobacterium lindanitolerans TaxID=428988 RepID=UPI0023EF7D56|nr:STM3941 family protein [Flavobacterium lindanitolerans]
MDTSSETIIIKLSRKKMILALLGSFLFVIMGIWMVVSHKEMNSIFLKFPLAVLILGILSILFFGFLAILIIKKLSSQTDGLIISSEGITDNSSAISAGFIPWTEITAITETSYAGQAFVIIVIKNPEEFIAAQKSSFKRKAMTANHKSFGGAVSISANSLQTTHKNLKKILVEKLTEYNRMNTI